VRGRILSHDHDRIIERIYDVVEDIDTLPDVLSALSDRIRGESAILAVVLKKPGPRPFASLFRLDPESMAKLNANHVQHLWTQHMLKHAVGVPVASDSFAPLDRLRRTDFYGEILEPQNIAHAALASVDDRPTSRVALSIHRSDAVGAFTAGELSALEPFLPHLRRSMQLRSMLDGGRRRELLALEALNMLATGVLLLDKGARVLFANEATRKLAATRDVIVLEDGTVRARHGAEARQLRGLIASAIRGEPGGALALSRASGGLPLSVLVSPLQGALGRAGAAAVFLSDPGQQAERLAERVGALYGLTPTEARVAVCIGKASTIAHVALGLQLGPETVRTHLKRIYAKTGVNRQSALARLVDFAAVTRLSQADGRAGRR